MLYNLASSYCIIVPIIVYITLYFNFDDSLLAYYLLIHSCLFPFLPLENPKINISSTILIILSGLFLKKNNNSIYLVYCSNLYAYFYLFLIIQYIIDVIYIAYGIKEALTYK